MAIKREIMDNPKTITQGRVSQSVGDFPFLKKNRLEAYHDSASPAAFFGCYSSSDYDAIRKHDGLAVIYWCGVDALAAKRKRERIAVINRPNVFNVTPLPMVKETLVSAGLACELVPPSVCEQGPDPIPCGDKIYTYIPQKWPEYYNKKLVDGIIKKIRGKYKLVVGDLTVPRKDWYGGGIGKMFYGKCFVGLMLSDFAGGGMSVVDMGLFGRYCVTNVINSPNAIAWSNQRQILDAIAFLSNGIGKTNAHLPDLVWKYLDHTHEWLSVGKYKIKE